MARLTQRQRVVLYLLQKRRRFNNPAWLAGQALEALTYITPETEMSLYG